MYLYICDVDTIIFRVEDVNSPQLILFLQTFRRTSIPLHSYFLVTVCEVYVLLENTSTTRCP